MQDLGQTFKAIRQSRHISLESATGGEFSRSMLSRFENGKNDLTLRNFLTALKHVHVSLDEFGKLANLGEQSPIQSIQQEFYQLNSYQELEQLYQRKIQDYHTSGKPDDYLQAILIKARLAAYSDYQKGEHDPELQHELNFLHDYLFSIDIWYDNEIDLFSNTSPLFTPQLYRDYTEEILHLPHFPEMIELSRGGLLTLFLNGFSLCISSKDFDNASYFEDLIQTYYFKENEVYLRLVFLFGKGQLEYLKDRKDTGLAQMQEAVRIFRFVGCEQSAQYFQEAIEQLLLEEKG